MGRSYGKLQPGHEEAIYDLKKAGKSGREIRLMLAAGYQGEMPVSISADRVNKVAHRLREERDDLYNVAVLTKPIPEGLRILNKRLMVVAERETNRLERAERAGKLDANKLGRLAGALIKLYELQKRSAELPPEPDPDGEAAKKGDSPDGDAVPSPFAASLAQAAAEPAPDEEGAETPPGDAAPIADQVVKALRPDWADAPVQTVPHDPPSLQDGEGDSPDVRTGTATVQV